jgi:iron complex outermembrane recepter protein
MSSASKIARPRGLRRAGIAIPARAMIAGMILSPSATLAQTPASTPAGDADEQEIIVTGTKTGPALLQDVPSNISVVTGETIERANVVTVEDIARIVPGLSTQESAANSRLVTLRGLNSTQNQAQVSTYIDETLASDAAGGLRQTDFGLFDIERVEVLRGPQGTLYGAGSQGGTIRFITNKPDANDFSAAVAGSLGFRSRGGGTDFQLNAMVNVPIIADRLAVRAVGYRRTVGGFVDMPLLGLEDTSAQELYGGRLHVQLNLGPQTSLLATIMYEKSQQDNDNFVFPLVDARPNSRVLQPVENETEVYSLTFNHAFSFGSITANASKYERHTLRGVDSSNQTGGLPAVLDQFGNPDVFSSELRFASQFGGPFQMVAGLFYSEGDLPQDNIFAFVDPATGRPPFTTDPPGPIPLTDIIVVQNLRSKLESYAAFLSGSFQISPQWRVEGGLRLYEISTSFERTVSRGLANIPGQSIACGVVCNPPAVLTPFSSSKESGAAYRAQIVFEPTDDILTYLLYSEGFRPGGSNNPAASNPALPPAAPLEYESDFVKNYEFGFRSRFADGQVQINGALYLMQWQNIQVGQTSGGGFGYIANAGEAELKGIELESLYRPRALRGFSVGLNLRLSSQEITEGVTGVANAGQTIPYSTRWGASAFVEQSFSVGGLEAYLRADTSYNDDRSTEFSPPFGAQIARARRIDSFWLFNARAAIGHDNWEAAIFARNLFNVREPVNWFTSTSPFLLDRVVTNAPRTIGASLSYRF